jgi:HD superfamily phosphohydrolase
VQPERPYEFRDPIHGLVRLTKQEVQIVNTAVFQRLRRIRQLALADQVYPGATHTRFEHSLGVLHIAHRILERLDNLEQLFDNDIIAVRLAALLHDVGHGPFSHVSEHLLDRFYDSSVVGQAAAKEKIHEKITLDIITKVPEIATLMTEEQRDGVVTIIRGAGRRDFRRDIVSSTLDADKMDYLLRDAYYAGVRYGQFDLDKIVESFRVLKTTRETYLTVQEDAIFAVEQLILSKHHMTQQVYGHRVRTITDAMIVRGLELAIETDNLIRRIYAYDGSKEHLDGYLTTDDAKISAAVLESSDSRARSIFERLRDRHLYKELALLRIDESEFPDALARDALLTLRAEDCRRLETELAKHLGHAEWEVIVQRRSVKNPAYWAPGGLDPEAITVISRDNVPKRLSQYDELVVAKLPAAERLQVIAPWDETARLERDEKREEYKRNEANLRDFIIQWAGGHS